jgi:hypothetical protein
VGWVREESQSLASNGPESALVGAPQEMTAMPNPMLSTFTHPVRFREFSVIRFMIELLSVVPAIFNPVKDGRGTSLVRSFSAVPMGLKKIPGRLNPAMNCRAIFNCLYETAFPRRSVGTREKA